MQLVWAQCVIEINRAAQYVCARVRSGIYLQNLNFIGEFHASMRKLRNSVVELIVKNKKNTVLIYMHRRR